MTPADVGKILLLLVLAGALLAGLRLYQTRKKPPPSPELVRKLFHIGGGAIGLTLPWLFNAIVPVIVLAVVLVGSFAALRFVQRLRGGVGQVLLGVQRSSFGEFGYVVSMLLLFWLSHGDWLLYSVPLLVLALADAFAALIGEQYGRLQLHMIGGRKSYEGSMAFLLTAFFCVHVPVLLSARTGRLESLLVAVGVSFMVMMVEVAAWWGIDNIIVPLWSYLLLKSMLRMDALEIATHLAFLLALGLVLRFWRNRTTLGDDAVFGSTVWGYIVWTVGGLPWVMPPLIQFLIYATVTARTPADQQRVFRFPVALANMVGSMLWLVVYRQTEDPTLLLPFAACFGGNVAIIALVRQKFSTPDITAQPAIAASVAKGLLVVVPAVFLLDGFTVAAAIDLAFGTLSVLTATALFYRLQPALSTFPVDGWRWFRQATIVTAASTIALGLHYGSLPTATRPNPRDFLQFF